MRLIHRKNLKVKIFESARMRPVRIWRQTFRTSQEMPQNDQKTNPKKIDFFLHILKKTSYYQPKRCQEKDEQKNPKPQTETESRKPKTDMRISHPRKPQTQNRKPQTVDELRNLRTSQPKRSTTRDGDIGWGE